MLFTQNVLFLPLRVRFFLFWFWATVIVAIAAVAATEYKCVLNSLRFLSWKTEMYVYIVQYVCGAQGDERKICTHHNNGVTVFRYSIWCILYNCTVFIVHWYTMSSFCVRWMVHSIVILWFGRQLIVYTLAHTHWFQSFECWYAAIFNVIIILFLSHTHP